MLFEVKLYILFICLSCLFLVIREKVNIKIMSTYLLTSIFGIKTIFCLIYGDCYNEVYYLLISYIIVNILFVFYYEDIEKIFIKKK